MPAAIPEISPDVLPAIAIAVLLLVHVPPVLASLSVIFCPAHTFEGPVIDNGAELMVIVVADLQPAGDV